MTDQGEISRKQFITFRSDEQEFGADIITIREIRGWTQATLLSHVPEYVRGVINLRGTVLPVIDLKARLGRGQTEATAKHAVIVVMAGGRTVGLLVDAVSDILTIAKSDIQPVPELARDVRDNFVEGIAVLDDRMVTLIDMDSLTAFPGAENTLTQAA